MSEASMKQLYERIKDVNPSAAEQILSVYPQFSEANSKPSKKQDKGE